MAMRAFIMGTDEKDPFEPFVDNGTETIFIRSLVSFFKINPITPWEHFQEIVAAKIGPDDLPLVIKTKVTTAVKARALASFGETLVNGDIIFPDYSRGVG